MRLVIVGPGRMGQTVRAVATQRGHEVAREIGPGDLSIEAVRNVDLAIEFTEPNAAPANLMALARHGVPSVCGTTGWYDRLEEVRAAFDRAGVGLVYAPNFSLGVQLFLRIARETARLVKHRPEFDAWIVETHHHQKRDAPSGTAKALQDAMHAEDAERSYPVTSIRAGDVPGTHAVTLDALGESLTLTHAARDRTIFATGAIVAAEWLAATRARGVVEFEHILFPEDG